MHQVEISASVYVFPVFGDLGGVIAADLGRVVGTLGRARERDVKRVIRSAVVEDEDGDGDGGTGSFEGVEGRSNVEDEGR